MEVIYIRLSGISGVHAARRPTVALTMLADNATGNEGSPAETEGPPDPGQEPQPGYLRQTFTSSTSQYSHYGNERIRNSFSAASCWSVKAIPAKQGPHSLQDDRLARLVDVRLQKPKKKDTVQPRFFTPVRYGHSDYDAFKVKAKRDTDLRELNLISFSRKPFRLCSSKVKLQHEDIIENENFVYPTLGPSDDRLRYRGRAAELDKNKPSYGLFRPGGRATKEQQVKEEGRRFVPNWSRCMFTKLSEDWPQLRFKLRFTTDDEFVFSFEAPAPLDIGGDEATPSSAGAMLKVLDSLNRYMKHFAAHGLASEFRLIKRGDRWNCLEPVGGAAAGTLSPVRPHAESVTARGTQDPSTSAGTRRLRFEDTEGALSEARDLSASAPAVAKAESPREESDNPPPTTAVVYSFYAPWVTVASAKTRKMESLRGRVLARSGTLNLAQSLAPIQGGAADSSANNTYGSLSSTRRSRPKCTQDTITS